jgi:hypothetical protein
MSLNTLPNQESNYSDNWFEVAQQLKFAAGDSLSHALPANFPRNPRPSITLENYKHALAEVESLQKVIDSKASLLSVETEDRLIKNLLQDSKIKRNFPSGSRFCLVPLPCNPDGLPLDDDQIKNSQFLQILFLDSAGNTVQGFGQSSSQVFRMLPPELQQTLPVTLGTYQDENIFNISDSDRQMLESALRQAFQNARQALQ